MKETQKHHPFRMVFSMFFGSPTAGYTELLGNFYNSMKSYAGLEKIKEILENPSMSHAVHFPTISIRKIDIEKALLLKNQGWSLGKIGKEFGCSKQAVWKAINSTLSQA